VPPQDGQFDGDAFFGVSAEVWGRTAAVDALGTNLFPVPVKSHRPFTITSVNTA